MDDYLTKPVQPKDLYDLLARWLAGGGESLDRPA
jgi:CheY-like chemotaxis protein